MIQLACDVPRHIANRDPDDFAVDAVLDALDENTDPVVQPSGRESARVDRRQVEERACRRKCVELVPSALEITLDESLSRNSGDALLVQLTPSVRARVVDRAAVVDVRRDLAIDVIMPERHVVPTRGTQLVMRDLDRGTVGRRGCGGQHPLHLAMDDEDVEARARIRRQRRPDHSRDVRDCENRQLLFRKAEPRRLTIDDVQAELCEELKNAAHFGRARRVVIAGHEEDDRLWQLALETPELQKRVEDRLVRRPDAVEDVSRYDDDIRAECDYPVYGHAKGRRDVRFPLIDPTGSEPLILPVPEM